MSLFTFAKDYVDDLCDTLQSGSYSVVLNLKTWYHQGSLSRTSPDNAPGAALSPTTKAPGPTKTQAQMTYEILYVENIKINEEYKNLKGQIDQLILDYESSKVRQSCPNLLPSQV